MNLHRVVILLSLIGVGLAYRIYQDRIPNGDIVPHPCKPNFLWRGVGHMSPLGGGNRNPFGKDFHKDKKWTRELCMMDSDNDGMTNGQELGDPDCEWTENSFPKTSKGITHPGICDPWGSDKCKEINKDISCDTGEFVCPEINSPDVFNITLRFPRTKVPARVTAYMCMTFELDMLEPGVDYHLIATEPFVDNPYVLHHTVLTGCGSRSSPLSAPQDCLMGQRGCDKALAVWTLGMPGDCIYKEAGFKLGTNGFTRLSMQHHWTNPELLENYEDSSGMTLYLTKKLRKYNAAYFNVGNTGLTIPPGESRWVQTASCTSGCTRRIIKGDVYLMTGLNHMHYLGYQQNVEHYRNGAKLSDLTPDEAYSYDNPIVHEYKPPVQLKAGDNLETTCVYKSSSRATTTFFGAGTYEEMCFGIFTYYPAENIMGDCLQWKDLDQCYFEDGRLFDCSWGFLFNSSHPEYKATVTKTLEKCGYHYYCRKECPAALRELKQHPCFSSRLEERTLDILSNSNQLDTVRLAAAMHSCDTKPDTGVFPSGQDSLFASSITVLAALVCTILNL